MKDPASQDAIATQLVVIGASAGGVEALSILVATLPSDFPAAIVIAQHLDPLRPSHLGEILGRRGPLSVTSVENTERLHPGTIYVVPSNRHVIISDHEVTVQPDGERPSPSIDLLLTSAARAFGERLIAVVLTGLGSDGAAGAHAVKEAGGTVIIQDPATAAYPSMPRSLSPPLVDVIASLEQIGGVLVSLLGDASAEDGETEDLSELLARLHRHRGVDFTAYKPPTIRRRLRRRMLAAGVATVPAYIDVLDADPDEERRLVADLLIKVTRFFRDGPLFDELRDHLLPELLDAAGERRELRIWSAGCATGEEAYSIAILLFDLMARRGVDTPVRIFATDLDDQAVAFARRGIYPSTSVAGMPQDLVARHFVKREGGFEVRQEIRRLIVFGSHDLGQRPPFPHTDLVLCRNVLIYFTPELQRRALDTFAYSLRDGGYLVLGKSETAGPADPAFTPVARQLRIYRREGTRAVVPPSRLPETSELRSAPPFLHLPAHDALARALRVAEDSGRDAALVSNRSEGLLRRLPVGIAVVDRRYDLESINGAGRELLGIHGTAIGQDLIHLAGRVPSTALRNAIDAVFQGKPSAPLDTVVTAETATGETRHLAISCHADRVTVAGAAETAMVVVTDVTAVSNVRASATTEAADLREELARAHASAAEMEKTKDRLALANRQLLDANREITDAVDQLREQTDELRFATASAQVAAEEIETLNEELQSSNEELETLHEEAQATVEELNVANEELQARAAELEELASTYAAEQARLTAILAGMGDAVLVVDRNGRTVLDNAAFRALNEVVDTPFVPGDDRGDPLPIAATPQVRVARGEEFRMDFTAAGPDGTLRSFEAIGRPLAGVEAGVLVVRDITDRNVRRLQEEFLSWAGHELRGPLAALQGLVELAARRAGPDADERLTRYLKMAVEQTRRQAMLIDELVEATRLRSGRMSLHRLPVDIVELAQRVVETAQALAEGHTIALEVPSSPVVVEVDAGRIEQVLVNLLTNATAYAVGTPRIEVSVRRTDDGVEVAVQDSGPGIPEETLSTVFDQFSRGRTMIRPSTGGLGLGLYISREIVLQHGDTINVASTLGEGATFTVRLPSGGHATEPVPGAPPPRMGTPDGPARHRRCRGLGGGR